ncbi:MAG: CinA family nicotinamide mononucleotide deamidase-related protein [Euzebya sp.]
MRAEVIAIGTELLLGDNVDSNSAWISGRLSTIGVQVVRHTTVGDDLQEMTAALRSASESADVVVVTGGLGPTQDDLTRVALARVAGVELRRDPAMVAQITEWFSSRGYEMPATNLQQADLPEGAWWLTRVGTAPGLGLQVGATVIYCLPGVPREMQVIMDADVITDLQQRGQLEATVTRTVRTTGLGEGGIAATLAPVVTSLEAADKPRIAFLASRGETRVKVTATAGSRDAALALVDPVISQIVDLLGRGVVGLDDDGVEVDIGRRLVQAGLTLAVAESVTGGAVGARLVGVAGASEWFRGGLITYATDTKVGLAGLDQGELSRQGPVSESTAKALAVAAVDRLEADIGLSVVGVAGPATQAGQLVGKIWIGWVGPEGIARARQITIPGRSRADVQEFAATSALSLLHGQVARLTS